MDPIKENILAAAVAEAEDVGGYDLITRGPVAARAGCATGMVNKHWGTMPELMTAVLWEFIKRGNLKQIARALVNRHPEALKLDDDTRQRAAQSITA